MKFEIKKTEYVNRTYRIPKELADRLSLIAQQEDISVKEKWLTAYSRQPF